MNLKNHLTLLPILALSVILAVSIYYFYRSVDSISRKLQNLDDIKNKKVLAFAGIANPANFFDLLKNNNIEVIETLNFPDHYNFKKKDIINLNNRAIELNAYLVTTEKDYFRLNNEDRKNINCLKIELLINNKEEFINELKKII